MSCLGCGSFFLQGHKTAQVIKLIKVQLQTTVHVPASPNVSTHQTACVNLDSSAELINLVLLSQIWERDFFLLLTNLLQDLTMLVDLM